MFTVSCTSSKITSIKKPARPDDAVICNLSGSIETVLDYEKITVKGKTNLMNGTVAKVSIFSSDGNELVSEKITIDGENFAVCFDKPADFSGNVYGFLSCSYTKNGDQPKEVIKEYGKNFLNIDGENVIWNSREYMFVLMSETVEL